MDQIRHTFLHYELDPLAEQAPHSHQAAGTAVAVGEAIAVGREFQDRHLAAGDRMPDTGDRDSNQRGQADGGERMRAQAVDDAVKQGYILTRTFYDDGGGV
jgi:hypothetical protein